MSDSCVTPQTVVCQAPLAMGFFRQEYWSGVPLPSLGDLPDLGIKPASPSLAGDFLPLSHQGSQCLVFYPKANFWNYFMHQRWFFFPTFFFLYVYFYELFQFLFLAMSGSLQNLSSPTRNWTWALSSESFVSQLLDHQGISSTFCLTKWLSGLKRKLDQYFQILV